MNQKYEDMFNILLNCKHNGGIIDIVTCNTFVKGSSIECCDILIKQGYLIKITDFSFQITSAGIELINHYYNTSQV